MPIPSLNFDDPIRGLPDQPIPIRYAALVTGLPPYHFLQMIREAPCPSTGLQDVGFASDEMHLPVYEYNSSRSQKLVTGSFYPYLGFDHRGATKAQFVKALPPTHYVWSEGLCDVFLTYVDFYRHRKGVPNSICWKPQLFGVKALIEECVDLSPLNASTDAYVFRRTGSGTRDIVFAGAARVSLKDSTGLRYLRELLRCPGKTISARDLSTRDHPGPATKAQPCAGDHDDHGDWGQTIDDGGHTGETYGADADIHEMSIHDGGHAGVMIDEKAKKDYQQGLKRKKAELAQAEEKGDAEQSAKLGRDILWLEQQLCNGTIRGQPKFDKSTSKRAYDAVEKAIRRAIADLKKVCPACGRHIDDSVEYKRREGWTYRPTHELPWKF